MYSTYQTLQCLLYSKKRVGVLFCVSIQAEKSMQNHRLPSFFCINTTALHQVLWLGLIAPDSNISCRWFQTSSTNGRGICLNHSLKGVPSITFIMCSVEWVQPNSTGSWYLAKSQWAASANSGSKESRPPKSNSSNNLPCLCLMVSLGALGSLGSSAPSSNCTSSGGSGTGDTATTLATRVFFWRFVSMQCCSLQP